MQAELSMNAWPESTTERIATIFTDDCDAVKPITWLTICPESLGMQHCDIRLWQQCRQLVGKRLAW